MGTPAQTFDSRLKLEGPLGMLRRYAAWRRDSVVRWATHRDRTPTLTEFLRAVNVQTQDPWSFIEYTLGVSVAPELAVSLDKEFSDLLRQVTDRHAELRNESIRFSADPNRIPADLPYPISWAVEDTEARVYHHLVRLLKPNRVVETGVANGFSSFFLLSAMERNHRGTLTSLDVSDNVGRLVPPDLREAWDLRILPRKGTKEAFHRAMGKLAGTDLFIHDSDHSYGWQDFEYAAAWHQYLHHDGLLLSDDADLSYAFVDFVRSHRDDPLFDTASLVCRSKVLAMARHRGDGGG